MKVSIKLIVLASASIVISSASFAHSKQAMDLAECLNKSKGAGIELSSPKEYSSKIDAEMAQCFESIKTKE